MENIKKILHSHPFIHPRFLQNYTLQTFIARYWAPYYKISNLKPERKLIKIPEGSQLAAECLFQKDKQKHSTVVILSGFTGTSSYSFCLAMLYKAYRYGFNAIALMQRGWGDTMHLTQSLYTGPFDEDVNVALEQFAKWGLRKFYLTGFSYGGYLALSAALRIKKQDKAKILGNVVIAPLINLDYIKHVEKHPSYHKQIVRSAKKLVKKRIEIDPPGTWDENILKKVSTLKDWYKNYMHTFGYPEKFSSYEDYRQKSDILPLFPKIKVPTLIINAYDDPISPTKPFEDIKNPNIITLLTKHGGHGGFFTTKKLYGDLDGHWAQNRALEFIRLLDKK